MIAGPRPRVLVTGAGGFVGSAIVRHLRSRGLTVVPTGRLERDPTCGELYRKLDVLEPHSICESLEGADVVIHAAGLAHQFDAGDEDERFMRLNAHGTENVARAAAACSVRHFVLLSSVSVYGVTHARVITEDDECRPDTPYAKSKLEAERRAAEIAQKQNMRLTILRLATVYGEGDKGNIARLIRSIDTRRFVWIGSGLNRKSLVHCDDVGRACMAALMRKESSGAVYNVSAAPYTLREIVECISQELNRPLPSWHLSEHVARRCARMAALVAPRGGKLERFTKTLDKWLADNVYEASRFLECCGFEATVSLREGLRREVLWYRGRGVKTS